MEKDNWADYYSMVDGGTAFSGKLEYQGKTNIAAPAEGIYLFDVSLSGLSYKLTPITSVSYTGPERRLEHTPHDGHRQPLCIHSRDD